MSMIELKVISGPDKGLRIGFGGETIEVGRDGRNAFVLSDPRVSPQHGQIILSEAKYHYVDLDVGSTVTHGDVILRLDQGGRRSAELLSGSCIGIGSSVIEVNIPRHRRARTSRLHAFAEPMEKKGSAARKVASAGGVDAQELIDWSGSLTCWDGRGSPVVVRTMVPVDKGDLSTARLKKKDKRQGPTASVFSALPPREARVTRSWVEVPGKGEVGLPPKPDAEPEGHAATAARLFRTKESQLAALLQLCDRLSGEPTVGAMLSSSLEDLLAVFPRATCVGLFLCTAEGVAPRALCFALGAEELPPRLAFCRKLVERVVSTDAAVRHPQGVTLGDLDREYVDGPTQSAVLVPVRVKDGPVVGVFGVSSHADNHAFSTRDILRCEAVAGFLASALVRALGAEAQSSLFERGLALAARSAELGEPQRVGHAERLAASSAALARAATTATHGRFAAVQLQPSDIERIRLAGLLYDIGRGGVDPTLRTRRSRLDARALAHIQLRFEHIVARFTALAQDRLLRTLAREGRTPTAADVAAMAQERSTFETYLQRTMRYLRYLAEQPSLTEEQRARLEELRVVEIRLSEGESYRLIDPREHEALAAVGFLTNREARAVWECRQRASALLEALPWPPELQGIPALIGHFQRQLDGHPPVEGAPRLALAILAVAHTFDTLLIEGVPQAMAVSVLQQKAAAGAVDPDLAQLFARIVAERTAAGAE